MKKTNFTPAPWSAKGDWMIVDKSERLIAQFESLNDELSNCNTPESFANSDLIAAAPDMYKLLANLQIEGGLSIARHREIDRMLAKARGEQ
jgi:hypothetical protein